VVGAKPSNLQGVNPDHTCEEGLRRSVVRIEIEGAQSASLVISTYTKSFEAALGANGYAVT
jgi:hypothetical protein